MSGRLDFLLDENGDLAIENGDLVIGDSDQQHVESILVFHKGALKRNPLVGFGITRYLKKTNAFVPEFLRELKVQLDFDGYKESDIDLTEGMEKININI